jgi:hypothetical protein
MVLNVGAILCQAKEQHPDQFAQWVEQELPFGLGTARRLMAIHLAFKELPPEIIGRLPKPWQALFAIRKLSRDELEEHIDNGVLSPTTTVQEAKKLMALKNRGPVTRRYSTTDLLIGKLMDHNPDDVDSFVWEAFLKWCGRRTTTV